MRRILRTRLYIEASSRFFLPIFWLSSFWKWILSYFIFALFYFLLFYCHFFLLFTLLLFNRCQIRDKFMSLTIFMGSLCPCSFPCLRFCITLNRERTKNFPSWRVFTTFALGRFHFFSFQNVWLLSSNRTLRNPTQTNVDKINARLSSKFCNRIRLLQKCCIVRCSNGEERCCCMYQKTSRMKMSTSTVRCSNMSKWRATQPHRSQSSITSIHQAVSS